MSLHDSVSLLLTRHHNEDDIGMRRRFTVTPGLMVVKPEGHD